MTGIWIWEEVGNPLWAQQMDTISSLLIPPAAPLHGSFLECEPSPSTVHTSRQHVYINSLSANSAGGQRTFPVLRGGYITREFLSCFGEKGEVREAGGLKYAFGAWEEIVISESESQHQFLYRQYWKENREKGGSGEAQIYKHMCDNKNMY